MERVLVLFSVSLFVFFGTDAMVLASDFGNFEVPIPGLGNSIDDAVDGSTPFLTYAGFLFNAGVGLIVLLGLTAVIIGGYRYMVAGGNASSVSEGKAWVGAGLLGIALALGSWAILNTISSQFTSGLREPEIVPPPGSQLACYAQCYDSCRGDAAGCASRCRTQCDRPQRTQNPFESCQQGCIDRGLTGDDLSQCLFQCSGFDGR